MHRHGSSRHHADATRVAVGDAIDAALVAREMTRAGIERWPCRAQPAPVYASRVPAHCVAEWERLVTLKPVRRDADAYDVIDGDLDRDRETVIGLWRGVIGWQDQLERMYDVAYLRCPFGRPLLKLLRHHPTGTIVGCAGAGPRPSLWQGQAITTGVACHLAVAREHRSLQPAIKLIRVSSQACAERFPITSSLTTPTGAAAERRAGFQIAATLQRYVKPLRYRPLLQARLPGLAGTVAGQALDGLVAAARHVPWRRPRWHAEWSATVDPRMQQLWEDSPHDDVLQTVRSTTLLHWRFLELPAIDRRFLLAGPAPGAPLVAWFVCETNVRTPAFMTVTDAWFAGGVREADRDAIRMLCDRARAAGYAAIEVRLIAAPPVLAAWQAEGFRVHGGQPMFMFGSDGRRADGSLALHVTDIEQDG